MFCEINFDNREEGYGEDGVIGDDKMVEFQVAALVFTLLAIALERHRAVITPLAPRCLFYSICFKMFLFFGSPSLSQLRQHPTFGSFVRLEIFFK